MQFQNKARQKAFQAALAAKAQAREAEEAERPAKRKRTSAEQPAVQRKLPADRRRKVEAQQDAEDFALDARLLKKLKRGALSEVGPSQLHQSTQSLRVVRAGCSQLTGRQERHDLPLTCAC